MVESDFCDRVKSMRVGKEGTLLQVTFWRGKVQRPYSAVVETQFVRIFVRGEMPTDYHCAKAWPFPEDFRARLVRSRGYRDPPSV